MRKKFNFVVYFTLYDLCVIFEDYMYIYFRINVSKYKKNCLQLVFRERSSRKTVSFKEQIMSKDKYPSIFSQPN